MAGKKYQAAIDIIKKFEGIVDGDKTTPHYDPYLDPVNIWTIGFGHVVRDKKTRKPILGKPNKALAFAVYPGGIDDAEVERLLKQDLRYFSKAVMTAVKVPLKNTQLCALISFTFNVGDNNFRNSTLLKKLNANGYTAVPTEMTRWNKANGKVLAGLTRRRAAEGILFSS